MDKALLVENDPDAAEILLSLLKQCGYDFRHTADAAMATTVCLHWQPTLVLIDIDLPVLDGYQLAKQLKADPAGWETRIVAICRRKPDLDRQREAGIEWHLRMPFTLASVRKVIPCNAPEEVQSRSG